MNNSTTPTTELASAIINVMTEILELENEKKLYPDNKITRGAFTVRDSLVGYINMINHHGRSVPLLTGFSIDFIGYVSRNGLNTCSMEKFIEHETARRAARRAARAARRGNAGNAA